MARIFTPDADRLTELGYAGVGHVPVLFDNSFRYCREHNRYLRERALGEWSPKLGGDTIHFSEPLSRRGVRVVAEKLSIFIDWCEAEGRDWREVDYNGDLLVFQNSMTDGTWSPSGKKLARTTANGRADEATSFLVWAAWHRLRRPLEVPYKASHRRLASGTSSSPSLVPVRTRLGRLKISRSGHIAQLAALPRPTQVRDWLSAVREKRGEAKYLACRFILETGVRRKEVVAIEEHQIPVAVEIRKMIEVGHLMAGIGLTETKGDRPRTILLPLDFMAELRRWIDGRRMRLRMLWTKRVRTQPSSRLFLSDSKGHEGTPLQALTIYKCFHDVEPRPLKWHPHFARHTYVCFTTLRAIEQDARIAGRDLPSMGADWIVGRGQWHVKALQHQLGHLDEATTEMYLRWLSTAGGMADVAHGWHRFLSGGNET